jgi:hypothetical protein
MAGVNSRTFCVLPRSRGPETVKIFITIYKIEFLLGCAELANPNNQPLTVHSLLGFIARLMRLLLAAQPSTENSFTAPTAGRCPLYAALGDEPNPNYPLVFPCSSLPNPRIIQARQTITRHPL